MAYFVAALEDRYQIGPLILSEFIWRRPLNELFTRGTIEIHIAE